jgi:hypothetical protein
VTQPRLAKVLEIAREERVRLTTDQANEMDD